MCSSPRRPAPGPAAHVRRRRPRHDGDPQTAGARTCRLQAGAVQLHLGIEADFRPADKAHPGLRVTNMEAFAARLEAGGAQVAWDGNRSGHRRFRSWDPVGNRLEFLEPASTASGQGG